MSTEPTPESPTLRALPADLVLLNGSHDKESFGREMCVMESVAYVAGEEHTDRPACACPVISAFLRSWNDSIRDDAHRTELLAPFIPRLVGTVSTAEVARMRADLALDWLTRVNTPAWLDLSPSLKSHAAELRKLAPLNAAARVSAAHAVLFAARDASSIVEAAAWDAARDAAWDAARDAAWAAAWDAARDAAWDAARDAAWDAARDALLPSVAALEISALELVNRMLAVTPATTPEELDALCDWTPVAVKPAEVPRG